MKAEEKAKGKAIKLIESFYRFIPEYENPQVSIDVSKQCALICVDEIIEATKVKKYFQSRMTIDYKWIKSEYWQKVKQEIEKL